MDDIKIISNTSDDNNDKTLKEAYQSLYNSLGIEPGLLNKTQVGRNISQKYRDDSIDGKIYSLKCLYNIENKSESEKLPNNHIVTNTSPFYGHDIVEPAPEIKDSLWQIIRKFQYQEHLTTEDVIKEMSEYLEKYAPNYYIKKILM